MKKYTIISNIDSKQLKEMIQSYERVISELRIEMQELEIENQQLQQQYSLDIKNLEDENRKLLKELTDNNQKMLMEVTEKLQKLENEKQLLIETLEKNSEKYRKEKEKVTRRFTVKIKWLEERVKKYEHYENQQALLIWLRDYLFVTHENKLKEHFNLEMPIDCILLMSEENQREIFSHMISLMKMPSTQMDYYFLTLLKILNGKMKPKFIREIIEEHCEDILVYMHKTPKIHSLLMEILLTLNLNAVIQRYRKMIITKHWDELVIQLTGEQLVQLFWLSYLEKEDELFIEKCSEIQIKAMTTHDLSPIPLYTKERSIKLYEYYLIKIINSSLFNNKLKKELTSKFKILRKELLNKVED